MGSMTMAEPARSARLKSRLIPAVTLSGLIFWALMKQSAALVSCPEYNSSIPAALKNALDWVSRPVPGEAPLGAFEGKVAALLAASPGALGGLRGLVTVRSILGNIRVLVLPDQMALIKAHEAFDEHDKLRDARQQAAVEGIARKLVDVCRKLNAA